MAPCCTTLGFQPGEVCDIIVKDEQGSHSDRYLVVRRTHLHWWLCSLASGLERTTVCRHGTGSSRGSRVLRRHCLASCSDSLPRSSGLRLNPHCCKRSKHCQMQSRNSLEHESFILGMFYGAIFSLIFLFGFIFISVSVILVLAKATFLIFIGVFHLILCI